jgi:hypothetical protein
MSFWKSFKLTSKKSYDVTCLSVRDVYLKINEISENIKILETESHKDSLREVIKNSYKSVL